MPTSIYGFPRWTTGSNLSDMLAESVTGTAVEYPEGSGYHLVDVSTEIAVIRRGTQAVLRRSVLRDPNGTLVAFGEPFYQPLTTKENV
jgi:hypothetical protein